MLMRRANFSMPRIHFKGNSLWSALKLYAYWAFLFSFLQQFTIFGPELFLYYQIWVIPIFRKSYLHYAIYFIIPKIELFYYAWPFIWPIFTVKLIKMRNTNWWNKMSAPKDCYLRLQTIITQIVKKVLKL